MRTAEHPPRRARDSLPFRKGGRCIPIFVVWTAISPRPRSDCAAGETGGAEEGSIRDFPPPSAETSWEAVAAAAPRGSWWSRNPRAMIPRQEKSTVPRKCMDVPDSFIHDLCARCWCSQQLFGFLKDTKQKGKNNCRNFAFPLTFS